MIRRAARKAVSFYHGPLDLPAAVVMVLWGALWLLWPLNGVHPERVRMPVRMRIRCADLGTEGGESYRRPLVFLDSGFRTSAPPSEDFAEMLRATRTVRSRTSANDGWLSDNASASPLESLAKEVRVGMGDYAPLWQSAPAFLRSGPQEPQLVIRCSKALRRAGLQLGDVLETSLVNGRTWQIEVYLESDGEGNVQHVLVEQSSGDPERDARLVRSMYKARLPASGSGVHGRITISYDRQ